MKRGLFRREVIESRRQLWLGEIELARPLPLALLTVAVVAVVLGVAAFLAFGEYTRKARIDGVLVPDRGVMPVVAPQAGLVRERLAAEGDVVRQGQPLFVLSLEQTSAGGDTQAAIQRSLAERERSLREAAERERTLLTAQLAGLQQRVARMRDERASTDGMTRLQQQRLALAQQEHSRFESLRAENFVSFAQVQAKAAEVLGVQSQLGSLERERAANAREIATLEVQLNELPLQAQARIGALEREIAELNQMIAESQARRQIVISAPADGVLSAVVAQPGQPVASAAELATVLPAGAVLQAHLYAPSSAVGFVRARQSVLLRYQAFPYQKFGHHKGEVVQVSRTPLPAPELGGAASEPMYRITVALERQAVLAYGHPQPLAAGMRLQADVLLDRRRLIEWIFEPVLGLTGRIQS
jgi:membrane fusion protein